MKRVSIVALLAIILGTSGCCCFRRQQAAAPVAAACPAPAPMVCDPCQQGAVSYGYGSANYGTPMYMQGAQ
jgi:hypothetical protein